MMTFVFDTSAIIRFLKRQAGHHRVEQVLALAEANQCRVVISAMNWGEVYYTVRRQLGAQAVLDLPLTFSRAKLTIIPVGMAEAERSAAIKVCYNFGYADCFGVQLAADIPGSTLLTADYGVKPAEHEINIEFLPPLPVQ